METIERPTTRWTPRMIAVAATCPRRFKIEFVENYRLSGRRPAPWPPDVRTILRDALRERDLAAAKGLSGIRVRAMAFAVVLAYKEELYEAIGAVNHDDEQRLRNEVDGVVDEAQRILQHYEETLGREPLTFETDSVGAQVDRLVESHLGEITTFADRIEGIVRVDGHKAVLVRKFTSTADCEAVIADLRLDLSTHSAMWAASRLAGEKVTSAVFEVIRTKAPSIPETIQCRKCRGSGRGNPEEVPCEECRGTGIGGMSRKACDTTAEEWRRAVVRAGLDVAAESARCHDVLETISRKGETFTYRVELESSDAAVIQWRQDVEQLIAIAMFNDQNGAWPRNLSACTGRGRPCPYRKVCSKPGDVDVAWFTQRIEQFPGLD